MRSLIAIGLLALTATAKFGPKWNELEHYTFDLYVKDYGLSYERGSAEWKTREANFNKRLTSIKAHNADSTKTWKRGVNQFADWSEAEFSQYNRATPSFHGTGKKVPVRSTIVKQSDLPRTVDYRTSNPPVLSAIKNQAACGNCWAHAATESVESYFAIKTGQLPVLSTQQITSCTTTENGCGGGGYGQAWDYVEQSEGLNEEWVYPFVNFFCDPPLNQQCTQKCQNISTQFTKKFKWWPKSNASVGARVQPNDATAMMDALANEGPVAISVGSDPWSDYESGILQNNYSNNASWTSINHAVQLVGYGYDFTANMNYWVVRNSWGTNYGEDGFIRLARPDVEPCFNGVCGTSGMLCDGAYPKVAELKKKNDFYF